MKNLCLLINEFPYGTWEPYVETECKYYKEFDKVWICSLQLRDEHAKSKRDIGVDAEIIPVRYLSHIQYFLASIFVLVDRNFYLELGRLIKSKRLNWLTLKDLVVYLSRAHHEARVIDNALKSVDKEELTLYSYRFEYQPYVAILLKKKWRSNCKIVCRAHGFDLYSERHPSNYIPLRETVLKTIDAVFPCSKYGVEYLQNRYPNYSSKMNVRYLGTNDHGLGPSPERNGRYRIVSCSNVNSIKRIERIIDALSAIDQINIEWIHYGTGPLFSEIQSYAKRKLRGNVNYIFKGHISNADLMKEYSQMQIDLFVNVSATEGLPVSIMEALSFGIPCVATKAGGTPEILDNKTYSRLLEVDFQDSDLSEAIVEYCQMPIEAYQSQRRAARRKWNECFNANTNYQRFVEEI